MENISPTTIPISEYYDLKGSEVGRRTLPNQKYKMQEDNLPMILKDLDLKRKFLLNHNDRTALMEQLTKDCQFLEKQNIMDYSLLICVHNKRLVVNENYDDFHAFSRRKHGLESPENEVIFMGIIDVLQPYNWRKQLETNLKSFFDDPEKISCVDPQKYSKRFQNYLNELFQSSSP